MDDRYAAIDFLPDVTYLLAWDLAVPYVSLP
jgi:hypothetical protein